MRNLIFQEAVTPKIYYPDNFKIEVVKHYKMHHNIGATFEKCGIARSTLFKWKKKYEENDFFRVSKRPANSGHKAKAHLDKLNKIVGASKELRCGVAASIAEKVAEIKRLEGKYSTHVLCEALQLPTGTYYNRKKKGDVPSRQTNCTCSTALASFTPMQITATSC